MNIFLDKSLPKKTQILLQILRVVLLVILFGGFFYASVNPLAGDILLYSGVVFAIVFLTIKIIVNRRKKNIAVNTIINNISEHKSNGTQ